MKGPCGFRSSCEAWCIHHALVQALIKDIEAWILCEGQRHGIGLTTWSILPSVSLSLHVGLLTHGKLLRLLVSLHLNRDLEDRPEIIQVNIVFPSKHWMCLQEDIDVLLPYPIGNVHYVISKPLLCDPGRVHATRLNQHVEDHVDALHVREGELFSDAADDLSFSEFAHGKSGAAASDHVGSETLVVPAGDFHFDSPGFKPGGISDREGISDFFK